LITGEKADNHKKLLAIRKHKTNKIHLGQIQMVETIPELSNIP
jgi:hypothetical protein